MEPERTIEVEASDVRVRDEAKREIDVRLLPWDMTIETVQGPEEFARGAFRDTPDDGLYLMGMSHAAQLGVGQDGKPTMVRTPAGRSVKVWDDDDGQYATFRVARTAAGDDILALADGIVRGVSVEFNEVPGGTELLKRGGRKVRRHNRVAGFGASLTHRPAYGDAAAVLAIRSQAEEAPVAEQTSPAPERASTIIQTTESAVTVDMFREGMNTLSAQFNQPLTDLVERLGRIEEQSRGDFAIPGVKADAPVMGQGEWFNTVLRLMTGERMSQHQTRALAEIITTDNLGVVPPQYSSEMIGIIDPARPFLDSTRRIDAGDSGMSLILPKIVTRPTVGVQAAEKDQVATTLTDIDTETFTSVTVAGGGDISIQLLKRSSPSFLSLYLELLAEALAIKMDDLAVDDLLAETAVVEGGILDPNDAELGGAWENGMAISRRLAPDTIWLSSAAVAAFIDAKASGTNAPLYSNIEANFTAAAGTGGTISGLRPVHVPALDDEAVDVIVGPSRGFLWAEDGAYTLQIDNPTLAGRDVALVTIAWFAPIYPAAFTTYTLPAS